jgi:hypothetical protein
MEQKKAWQNVQMTVDLLEKLSFSTKDEINSREKLVIQSKVVKVIKKNQQRTVKREKRRKKT